MNHIFKTKKHTNATTAIRITQNCSPRHPEFNRQLTDGLIAGRVDHIPQDLLRVLNAAPFGIAVPQKNQLLLLPGPEALDALLVDADDAKTLRTLAQRHDKVRVDRLARHVPESKRSIANTAEVTNNQPLRKTKNAI